MACRVLFVSYTFPPVGGAGVQRVVKFVKYLPQFGWGSSVLTAGNPSVPVHDNSLVADIPIETRIVRTRTWEPSYATKQAIIDSAPRPAGRQRGRRLISGMARTIANFALQPDAQVLWGPSAVRAGLRLLREVPHDAIVATGPPFSSFLIGAKLSRRSGVPLVLDYRDEWDLSNRYWENKQHNVLSLGIQRMMQHRVARRAKAIVATSRPSAKSLEAICRCAGSQARVVCIYNGFDPDDFSSGDSSGTKDDSAYRLAYIGTLWNLTTARPLVDAVQRLSQHRPDLAKKLRLIFVGRRTAGEDTVLKGLSGLPCSLEMHSYLEHPAAVRLMQSADGLCALLADVAGADRVVPAKVFEYMAAGKVIFGIAPKGELWDILQHYPDAHRLEPANVDLIAERLAGEITSRFEVGHDDHDRHDVSQYSRQSQAAELASLLESLQ